MEVWQGIDSYLQRVDQALCSPDCPCNINNPVPFSSNKTIAPIFKNWNTTDKFGATSFQNCTFATQENAQNLAQMDDKLFNPKKDFNRNLFARYMSEIEYTFNCAGWCNVTYVDPRFKQSTSMYKYQFSDVRR